MVTIGHVGQVQAAYPCAKQFLQMLALLILEQTFKYM